MDDEQKPESKKPEADIVIDEDGKEETPKLSTEEERGTKHSSRWQRFTYWYKSSKKKSIPLTVLVLLLILAALPFSRYHIAGLALKKDFSLQVVDSVTSTPVSKADVSIGSAMAVTNGSGKVTLRGVKVGPHSVLVSKKYYKDSKTSVLIPILKQKTTPSIKFVATGRQVKISVKNLINHTALDGVDIKIADISAKTDQSGNAIVVLPVGAKSEKATLSLNGYNDATGSVKVSDNTIEQNNFNLTPSGKVYFLSKLSGKIDVVKTNLDGTGRQTILAGTGSEDDNNTVLLASRDWKYLALLSRRAGGPDPRLYIIDTSTDNAVIMDSESSVTINPTGWSGHNFVYTLTRKNVPQWQAGGQALKSYNADNKKVITLDQTRASGTGAFDYTQENYGAVYQIGKNVVYDKSWVVSFGGSASLTDKQAGIYSVPASGGNPETLKTFSYGAGQSTYLSAVPYQASQIYYQVYEKDAISYYAYNNGHVSARSDIADDFNEYIQQGANTYLLSPLGTETFWSEPRDGKNTMFVGDQNGQNSKQIATLSDYQTYGWYTEDYLLVSKTGSELYVMPKNGPDLVAVKISDYHKPARSFLGYGGGYGGI